MLRDECLLADAVVAVQLRLSIASRFFSQALAANLLHFALSSVHYPVLGGSDWRGPSLRGTKGTEGDRIYSEPARIQMLLCPFFSPLCWESHRIHAWPVFIVLCSVEAIEDGQLLTRLPSPTAGAPLAFPVPHQSAPPPLTGRQHSTDPPHAPP